MIQSLEDNDLRISQIECPQLANILDLKVLLNRSKTVQNSTMYMLLLYLLFLAHGSSLFAQSFELSCSGDRYTLVSENAPLSDILAEIDRREAASLNFLGDYDQTITATHQDLTLDMLLYELGVSYVLTYKPDEDGNYHLSDAMLLESGESGVDGETAAMLRKLVQDLRNDDIPWNANKAVYELRQIGCPAIPFLEEALYDEDFQRRHVAADLMRTICPEHRPGPRLIDLTFELLDEEEIEFNFGYLLYYTGAFDYLARSNIYQSNRGRILQNLYSADARTRLYSALLAAHHRETALVDTLARIMIPHLADNDLANDAAACAYALHQLGPAVLPHLQPYRHSSDIQQAELVHLICTALETDTTPEFRPIMFASYHRMPIEDRPRIDVNGWPRHRFPDLNGQYTNLNERRMTVDDYYGSYSGTYNKPSKYVQKQSDESFKMPERVGYYYDERTLPPRNPEGEEAFTYTVKQGDTLNSIAVKYYVPLTEIRKINPLIPDDGILIPGMGLRVPWH